MANQIGRAMASMDNLDYMRIMGANMSVPTSGSSPLATRSGTYFDMLRDLYVSAITWDCPQMPKQELEVIERFIFLFGHCAIVRPKVTFGQGRRTYISPTPRVFQVALSRISMRLGTPTQVSILVRDGGPIGVTYNAGEFALLSHHTTFNNLSRPPCLLAWEYANKLYELDLAFNAVSHKARMPMVFNNSSTVAKKISDLITKPAYSIAELMRSALGRNEQFVEVPENYIGEKGNFLHEPQLQTNSHLKEHVELQRRLIDNFLYFIGIGTIQERQGAYVTKANQEPDVNAESYFRYSHLRGRKMLAEKACETLGINLSCRIYESIDEVRNIDGDQIVGGDKTGAKPSGEEDKSEKKGEDNGQENK
jgi:hypothetical protein